MPPPRAPTLPTGGRMRRSAALAALGLYADNAAVNPTTAIRPGNIRAASWLCLGVTLTLKNTDYLGWGLTLDDGGWRGSSGPGPAGAAHTNIKKERLRGVKPLWLGLF